MHAGQGEAGHAVVERPQVGPGDGVVALGATCRRKGAAGCGVWWIVGLLPGCQVATSVTAVRRLDAQTIVATDMALRAGGHLARRSHLV